MGKDQAPFACPQSASIRLPSARIPDRDAMNAILLVLRTGMQWNALNTTGICSRSANRHFPGWRTQACSSVFGKKVCFYDWLKGIGWNWLSRPADEGRLLSCYIAPPRLRHPVVIRPDEIGC